MSKRQRQRERERERERERLRERQREKERERERDLYSLIFFLRLRKFGCTKILNYLTIL